MASWVEDVIEARGHPNVRALHRTTFEVTRESHLTPRGDCIIGVRADKAARDLNPELRLALRNPGARVLVILETPGSRDQVEAWGSEGITADDDRRIIVRRSSYVEPATIAVRASKAARHLSRELVSELRQGTRLTVVVRAQVP